MKVCLLHETVVGMDDHYTKVLGCYADKSLAEEEKERLEVEFKLSQKCEHCPLYICPKDSTIVCCAPCDSCKDKNSCAIGRVERAAAYCNKYEPEEDGDGDLDTEDCANYEIGEDKEYFIVEYELIKK